MARISGASRRGRSWRFLSSCPTVYVSNTLRSDTKGRHLAAFAYTGEFGRDAEERRESRVQVFATTRAVSALSSQGHCSYLSRACKKGRYLAALLRVLEEQCSRSSEADVSPLRLLGLT